MKKCLVILGLLVIALPALVYSDVLTFKVGYFVPRAQNDPNSLWTTEFDNMSFKKSNFNGSVFGLGYEHFFTNELSIGLSVDFYTKNRSGFYRDYVGISLTEGDFAFPAQDFQGDFDISHSFQVSIMPIQLSLKLAPLGRRGRFIPYVGGGVGFYHWNVRLRGDIVDFSDVWIYTDPQLGDIDIFTVKLADLEETNRFSVGYHAFGGFMYPLGPRFTIEGEFKYNFVKGKWQDNSSFQGFSDFDLSGAQFTVGFNYWF